MQGETYLQQVLAPLFKKGKIVSFCGFCSNISLVANVIAATDVELNPEKVEKNRSFVCAIEIELLKKKGGSAQAAVKLTELCETLIQSSER